MGSLTTHVLDLATGKPAEGLELELFSMEGAPKSLGKAVTNADGRVNAPLLDADSIAVGRYRLTFQAGAYLQREHAMKAEDLFLDEIPLDFRVFDAEAKYHVPLLLSPFGYSTYRGS